MNNNEKRLHETFMQIIQSHMQQKMRLKRFIEDIPRGVSVPADIDCTHSCILGCWIKDVERSYRESKHYQNLKSMHDHLHTLAWTVVELVKNNDRDIAMAFFKNEYTEKSREMVESIIRLQREVEWDDDLKDHA